MSAVARKPCLLQVCAAAGVERADVVYVEAHGTGTVVGDAQELAAIDRMYGVGAGRTADAPLLIGSVKSNMGHCEGCSGLAGMFLCLRSNSGQNSGKSSAPALFLAHLSAGCMIPQGLHLWSPLAVLRSVQSCGSERANHVICMAYILVDADLSLTLIRACAALIKVCLAYEHGVLPANLHYTQPNPNSTSLNAGILKVLTRRLAPC